MRCEGVITSTLLRTLCVQIVLSRQGATPGVGPVKYLWEDARMYVNNECTTRGKHISIPLQAGFTALYVLVDAKSTREARRNR